MRYYPVTNKSRLYAANSVRDPNTTATTRLKYRVRRKKLFIQICSKKVHWIQHLFWANLNEWLLPTNLMFQPSRCCCGGALTELAAPSLDFLVIKFTNKTMYFILKQTFNRWHIYLSVKRWDIIQLLTNQDFMQPTPSETPTHQQQLGWNIEFVGRSHSFRFTQKRFIGYSTFLEQIWVNDFFWRTWCFNQVVAVAVGSLTELAAQRLDFLAIKFTNRNMYFILKQTFNLWHIYLSVKRWDIIQLPTNQDFM